VFEVIGRSYPSCRACARTRRFDRILAPAAGYKSDGDMRRNAVTMAAPSLGGWLTVRADGTSCVLGYVRATLAATQP
jgi:hypothetical protein